MYKKIHRQKIHPKTQSSIPQGLNHLAQRGENLKSRDFKLRGLSPRANYTDRAAAAGRRS